MSKKYDILIVGNQCGLDILFAEYLTRMGLKVCVIQKLQDNKCYISNIDNQINNFKNENIFYVKNPFKFIKYAYNSRLIVSFTGSLIGQLKYLILVKNFLFLPPIIHISTGSDMSELVKEKSFIGYLYRNYLSFVDMIYTQPYPNILANIIELKLKNVHFDYSFPFYILDEYTMKITNNNKEIIFFHFSHIDWQETDNKEGRNSSKGTNRFLEAFFKALDEGLHAKCIILERGPDKELAKQIIQKSRHKNKFIFKPHLSRNELIGTMQKSDILVDQFDVGGLGMGAIEGMSLSKPVLIYINEQSYKVQYLGNLPPVLNCQTENEIYEQIMKCQDREYLEEVGKKARDWVVANHRWDNCMDEFIFHYQRLTGHKVIDYINQRNLLSND